MIPRLKRREQLELNQNTEPNLNLTPQISFSGVEGKLDLLWLSASLASSWTSSPLSNLSHVLGVTPSWWHKQDWAQSERLCPPRWQRSELARVHRGLASLAQCQKCRSSMQKKNPNKPQSLLQAAKGLQNSSGLPTCFSLKRERPGDAGWRGPRPTRIPALYPRAAIPSEQSFFPQPDHQPCVWGSTNQKDNGDRAS